MNVFYVLRTKGQRFPQYRGAASPVRCVREAKRFPTLRDALKEKTSGWIALRICEVK